MTHLRDSNRVCGVQLRAEDTTFIPEELPVQPVEVVDEEIINDDEDNAVYEPIEL